MRFHEYYLRQIIQSTASILAKVLFLPTHPIYKKLVKEATKLAQANTEKYWLDEKSPLWEFLSKNGVKYQMGIVPPYSDGGAGRAYFLGKYVVKFSDNRVEANVAQMVKGNTSLPTVVIDVEYIDKGLYAILQPFVEMNNIPQEIKKASDYLTAVVDSHPDMQGFPSDKETQEKLCKQALEKNGGDPSLLPSMMVLIDLLSKMYQSTGFHHDDASPTNIGMHQGRIVIPDLGPNQTSNFDSLKALKQIRTNREKLGLPPHKSI